MNKFFCILLAIVISGCAGIWTSIDTKPTGAELVPHTSSSLNSSDCVALMNDMKTKSNNQEVNPSSEFQKRFITHLKDTRIFETVATETPAIKPSKYVTLTFESNENQDSNQGLNVFKGFIIGGSFYLLTPIIPLSYDFESIMTLSAIRQDGAIKKYEAKGSGSAKYHLFANAAAAGQEVRAEITNNNINSLMNQLAMDADFLCHL
ncbi:MAG: hypothetical protein ACXV8O_01415 [Methylobacter sp.]